MAGGDVQTLQFVMLNLLQHPSCLSAVAERAEGWTLKQVQGDG